MKNNEVCLLINFNGLFSITCDCSAMKMNLKEVSNKGFVLAFIFAKNVKIDKILKISFFSSKAIEVKTGC
jgi:hypothetical protein